MHFFFQIRIISLLVFNNIFLSHRIYWLAPGTKHCAMNSIFTNLILTTTLEVVVIIPILHIKKLRHGEIKVFAKGHKARLGFPSGVTPTPTFCFCFVDKKSESTKKEVHFIIYKQEQFLFILIIKFQTNMPFLQK